MDFDAVDGLPVYALFLTASPTPKIHLYILPAFSFCCANRIRGLIIPATPADLIISEARRMEKALK